MEQGQLGSHVAVSHVRMVLAPPAAPLRSPSVMLRRVSRLSWSFMAFFFIGSPLATLSYGLRRRLPRGAPDSRCAISEGKRSPAGGNRHKEKGPPPQTEEGLEGVQPVFEL